MWGTPTAKIRIKDVFTWITALKKESDEILSYAYGK